MSFGIGPGTKSCRCHVAFFYPYLLPKHCSGKAHWFVQQSHHRVVITESLWHCVELFQSSTALYYSIWSSYSTKVIIVARSHTENTSSYEQKQPVADLSLPCAFLVTNLRQYPSGRAKMITLNYILLYVTTSKNLNQWLCSITIIILVAIRDTGQFLSGED